MKKTLATIFIIAALLTGSAAFAQNSTIPQVQQWLTSSGYIKVASSTAGVWIPSLGAVGSPCIVVGTTGKLSTAACGGGSQTPWTGNIDGAGYTLSNAYLTATATALNLTDVTNSLVYANGIGRLTSIATTSLGLPTFSDLSSYLSLSSWYATTTDGLDEGLTNLYYTNPRVLTYLDTLSKGYFWSTTSADAWVLTKSLTAASSTFLSDTNTWSGTNVFPTLTTNSTTGTSTFAGDVTIGQVSILNGNGGANASLLKIVPTKTYGSGSQNQGDGALLVSCNANNGLCAQVTRNNASAVAPLALDYITSASDPYTVRSIITAGTGAALTLSQTNSSASQASQTITNAGSGAGLVINMTKTTATSPGLRITATSTNASASTLILEQPFYVTMVLTDLSKNNAKGEGKFQLTNRNDNFRFEGRDNSNLQYSVSGLYNRPNSGGNFVWGGVGDIFSIPTGMATFNVVQSSGTPSYVNVTSTTTSASKYGDIFTILNSGNTGIGTTSPYAKLSVDTNTTSGTYPLFVVASSSVAQVTVDAYGSLSVGTAQPTGTVSAVLQRALSFVSVGDGKTTLSEYAMWRQENTTASVGATQWFARSRGTSFASPAVVQNGDVIGDIKFVGWDSADWAIGGQITLSTNGTIGSNIMPSRFDFKLSHSLTNNLFNSLTLKSNGSISGDYLSGTSTKSRIMSEPDNISTGVATANYMATYSDDKSRMFQCSTIANTGVNSIRNGSFAATAPTNVYHSGGTAQTITMATISGTATHVGRGCITYQGYHYMLLASTTNAAATVVKRATSSDFINNAAATSWASSTISGVALPTGSFLVGAANGQIWIGTTTIAVQAYTIATSTNTLTASTYVPLAGAAVAINNTRVNNNGIYAGFGAEPYIRKYTLAGVAVVGPNYLAAAPSTTGPDLFVMANSVYAISGSLVSIITRLDGY